MDRVCHLVQDDALVRNIHSSEIPPDEYYELFRAQLSAKFPEATKDAVEHAVALCAAFDTASAFGLSFGCKKFQFMQKNVKLVFETVGEHGRQPNPAICEAIRDWPPINTLKDLQAFLGTCNYVRPHAGPTYARVMHPLRALHKADTVFPPERGPALCY